MPLVGIQWGSRNLTWEEAERESNEGRLPFPIPLLKAMVNERNDEAPSASTISRCLRQFELKKRVPYYEKPADMLPSVFGTAFHNWMEVFTEYDIDVEDITPGNATRFTRGPRHAELLLSTTVDTGYSNVVFRGRVDYFHEGVLIRDWKTKKYLGRNHEPPLEDKRQVSIYNWLAQSNGYEPAPEGEIVYVSQSWLATHRFPLAVPSPAGEYVLGRLRAWQEGCANGGLPHPVDAFFADPDEKGKQPPPCGYCPVREACMAAWRQEEEEAPFG